ncbi:lipoyl synthase [Desulfococcaceae bacterium OttesenSCG-928-F15]|nr:lipoyl synthase [Desulfococcaceae bacterium OttesenSCG-928-F15]
MTKAEKNICVRKPEWLRRPLPKGPVYGKVQGLLRHADLHTVCEEARCPNQFECFGRGTATFLILGTLCTRNCKFCNISGGKALPPDPEEPRRVAEAASRMGLSYAVVTSVTRDDLEDGGASHFAETICEIRKKLPHCGIEVLIPDFGGNPHSLERVLAAGPDVLNHNMETVPRLYSEVRPEAVYARSLALIARVSGHPSGIPAKSGLMLGLGENDEEILDTLQDLRDSGCRILTLGQYLQPSENHWPVQRFVSPEQFNFFEKKARMMGFESIASGPFVRSSYRAAKPSLSGINA